MNYDEILEQLRSKLGDDTGKNYELLRREAEKFAADGDKAGFDAANALIVENMPESVRNRYAPSCMVTRSEPTLLPM